MGNFKSNVYIEQSVSSVLTVMYVTAIEAVAHNIIKVSF